MPENDPYNDARRGLHGPVKVVQNDPLREWQRR